jgi:uncharacterized protein (UPF0147 family)
MKGGIKIPKRTSTKQSLKTTQIDGLKVNFQKVEREQEENLRCIRQVILEIFRSYKTNNFKNDKNLKLIKSFFLLRNIAKKDGNFVRLLYNNKELSKNTVTSQIDKMLQDSELSKKIRGEINDFTTKLSKNDSAKNTRADICDIMQDIIDEVSKDIQQDEEIGKKSNKDNKEESSKTD